MRKTLGIGAGATFAALVVVWLLGAGDIIDLPQWANVPGVDVPVVGDKDQIDCRLAIADDDAELVEITIVDGNPETYVSYVHIWNNGNLLDDSSVDRVDDSFMRVRPNNTEPEQFFSISTTPFREGRVFCESIILE